MSSTSQLPNVHFVPPHNREAEVAILASLMSDPEAWDQISDLLIPENFYKPAHGKIFQACLDLKSRDEAIDVITLSDQLKKQNLLESIGGVATLTDIAQQFTSSVNILSHAKVVREKALLRLLIKEGHKIIDEAHAENFEEVQSFINTVESNIFDISNSHTPQTLESSAKILEMSIQQLEALSERDVKGDVTGMASGYPVLDRMTAGFQKSDFVILAARPSMGKTALALNMCLHNAIQEKKKVAFFSLEMSKEQLMLRILSIVTQIPMHKVRLGRLSSKEWSTLYEKAGVINEAALYIDDSSLINPMEMQSKCRRLKKAHGLDVIFIDYLQLMGLKKSTESREREVAEISKHLKSLAKELDIPVVALAQLNRGVENRQVKRPMLQDLRESGSIEQDADTIMMLYRDGYYERENVELQDKATLIVAKQRNGPTGEVPLRWSAQYGIFESAAEMSPAAPIEETPSPSQEHPFANNLPKNFAPEEA